MLCRIRQARTRLPLRENVIRLSLLCLALLALNACSVMDMGKARIPPGASYGTPGRQSAPGYNGAGYSVVDTALSTIGTPYRWGGDSPNEGFDCSGLVYWVYARHGVRVPRPSWEQIRTGTPVGRSELMPGDLVFFKIARGSGFHVGIYAGRGVFVHSPKSGQRVRESSLSDDYWRSHYVGARRIPAPLRATR
ncbi:C40 family peptidase [Paucidesulfovibrio longus]|uniref:C40 family peptidase n=1 Tax=Paucidesulfovibrio longus TaxID=889 RepID=UPI0003B5FD81|nr:C40 family peptidase [Paucidesulfovibrio longus]